MWKSQTRVISEPASHPRSTFLYLPLFHSYLCCLIAVSSIAMDPINNRDNLFSRGPSPPPMVHQQFQPNLAHLGEPHGSPQGSIRDTAPSSSTHLDSLFHGLTAPSQPSQSSPQPSHAGSVQYANAQDVPISGPATPASVTAGSVASSGSAPSNTAADKQNALLSILGAVGSPATSVSSVQNQSAPAPPQQIPTPPGSAPRSGPSSGENPGKMLLEQLMAG